MKKLILTFFCLLVLIPCMAQVPAVDDVIKSRPRAKEKIIMTVRGPISASAFGKALVHEHVMCDFIGAAQTGPHRYNPDDVVNTMLPLLQILKQRGYTGFVDCTPAWLGRDAEVLLRVTMVLQMTNSCRLTLLPRVPTSSPLAGFASGSRELMERP
jgi:hypothetical protein